MDDLSQKTHELRDGLERMGVAYDTHDEDDDLAHIEHTSFDTKDGRCDVFFSFSREDDVPISLGWPYYMEYVMDGVSRLAEPYELLGLVR